jgi:hypothetical protein
MRYTGRSGHRGAVPVTAGLTVGMGSKTDTERAGIPLS